MNERLKRLIPKNENDTSTIPMIRELNEKDLKMLLPELLLFFYDANWIVTQELPPIMLRYPRHLLPLLIQVLAEDEPDNQYKWYVLSGLVQEMPNKYHDVLTPVLERLVYHPTKGETQEEVDITAKEILEEWEEQKSK